MTSTVEPLAQAPTTRRLPGRLVPVAVVWLLGISGLGAIAAIWLAGGGVPETTRFLTSGEVHRFTPAGAVVSAAATVFAYASYLMLFVRPRRTLRSIGLSRTRTELVVICAATAAGTAAAQAIGTQATGNTSPYDDLTWLAFVAVVVLVGITGPWLEELVWRGAIQATLTEHTTAWIAVPVQGAVFAVVHLPGAEPDARPAVLAGTFLFAALLGAVRAVTRRTTPGVFIHVAGNVATLLATHN